METEIPPHLPCLPAGRLCEMEVKIIPPLWLKRGARGDFATQNFSGLRSAYVR